MPFGKSRKSSGQPANLVGWIAREVAELRRLGFGQLSNPEIDTWTVRLLLLDRMRVLCARELLELRASWLPVYQRLFDLGRKEFPNLRGDFPHFVITTQLGPGSESSKALYVDSWDSLCTAARNFPLAEDLRIGLELWVKDRHLNVAWFRDALLSNFCGWRLSLQNEKTLRFSLPAGFSYGPDGRFGGRPNLLGAIKELASLGPALEIPAFNPAMQTRKEHKQLVLAKLELYHSAQEERFREVGFKPSLSKRARRNNAWEHMDWFIRYQVRGVPAKMIAGSRRGDISETAINRKIREIARLLEVPLRSEGSAPLKKL